MGIFLVLNGIPGKGHAKVLTAGIGWAGAEVLLTRFLLLWVGARGAEFDWKYIQKSLESNINLVKIYCLFNDEIITKKCKNIFRDLCNLFLTGSTCNDCNIGLVVV